MVNSPLIRPYLLGGSFGGGTLVSHDDLFRLVILKSSQIILVDSDKCLCVDVLPVE